MKAIFAVMFALTMFSAEAGARPPHWGGHCTVSFQKCDFGFAGNCLRWNRKTFTVRRNEARWACRRAEQQYGDIRNCYVNCRH